MATDLTPPVRDLLAESAERLELLDAYLAFGTTEQRRHAASCRELACRLRAAIDAAALRAQLAAR